MQKQMLCKELCKNSFILMTVQENIVIGAIYNMEQERRDFIFKMLK